MRAIRFGMYEKVVFDRFSPVDYEIGNTVCPDIQIAGATVFESEFPAFPDGQDKFLIRVRGFHRGFQYHPVIRIHPDHIVSHCPALADIAGRETYVVEFSSEIKYGI